VPEKQEKTPHVTIGSPLTQLRAKGRLIQNRNLHRDISGIYARWYR